MLQESHRLIIDGSNCGVCLQGFQTHQCIKTLPCQHPFHITCIDTWLTNHSQCPVDGSYIGSVSTAGSVATLQPNGHTVPGVGRFTTASNSTHALGGAGKRPGQRLKGLSDINESAKSLPSSFTLSGSGLLAGNNNNRSRWVTQNDWLPYRMGDRGIWTSHFPNILLLVPVPSLVVSAPLCFSYYCYSHYSCHLENPASRPLFSRLP